MISGYSDLGVPSYLAHLPKYIKDVYLAVSSYHLAHLPKYIKDVSHNFHE